MEYLSFAWKNRRFLSFGLLLTFFSCFGQSYFIAVFNTDIRAAFSLSHGEFGLAYAVATVSSAMCLIWIGKMIDRTRLKLFALCVCCGLIASCVLMAAAPVFPALLFALFALRLTGQGLMVHTSVTSIGRRFTAERGRAVSIISMGGPSGQAVMALIAVGLSAWLYWRQIWLVMAALCAIVLIPAVAWLLRGHEDEHLGRKTRAQEASASDPQGVWGRREVLKDLRFYLIMPVSLAPSFIATGFFFHMGHLVEAKGWTLAFFTGAYTLYTLFSVSLTLLTGPLIDRVGAVRILPWHLAPLCLGLVALAEQDARGYALRSRCDLVCDGRTPLEIVHADGSTDKVDPDRRATWTLYRTAHADARAAGFGFKSLTLKPQPKLVEIVRLSRKSALEGASGDEDDSP